VAEGVRVVTNLQDRTICRHSVRLWWVRPR
jgi:hypothetical protein